MPEKQLTAPVAILSDIHGNSPALEAVLAAADHVDGEDDKVVKRCAGCKLGMDGSEEHALAVADYTLHFCSADCKQAFAEDAEQAAASSEGALLFHCEEEGIDMCAECFEKDDDEG